MKALSWITNRQVVSALCAAPILLSCAYASAEEVAPAVAEPAPAYTLTYNLGVYSNYISRGNDWGGGPALQGGVDWAHSSGFYLGTWFSTTDPQTLGAAGSVTATDPSGNPLGSGNHVETDWYGGYAHTFGPVTLGVGGNYVWYPEGEKSYHNRNQDTFEGNLNVSAYGFTYTFYHAFTDWYGIGNTKRDPASAISFTNPANVINAAADTSGVEYHELKYANTLPFAGLNLAAKVGYQRSSDICLNQKDYLIGLNRNFSLPTAGKPLDGFNAGFNYTGTFGEEQCSIDTKYYTDDNGQVINDRKFTFYIKRSW
ncbi:TorF family putative porin [Methylotenera sp.]|uniref:TorF family putative porin n=1 Tax=Methylotenera sp. TaxID=2051956 RepID=UPI00248970CC|nr:TorF family putative porin [Methylotenera sp.]MDI1299629.1 TorF family putative porin [Methylotenera sp.]